MTRSSAASEVGVDVVPPALTPGVTGAEVAVHLEGVDKRFVLRRPMLDTLRHPFARRYQQAVRGVSCDVMAGEFFGLLGPNGAGKTTLFKIMATFVTPDSGTVMVGGADLRTHPTRVRQLVTPAVADERSLRWRLSSRENLRLFAALYGVPRPLIKNRIDELLDAVGLQDTGTKLVGQFSTGMKQRLLIARALIPRPRVLLLDEPTRGLDPILARTFRSFLREEIGRRQGCTVILATHNAQEAFELCDRVGILDQGRMLAVGSANTLGEEFGHQRYRVWTRMPAHPCFDELALQGVSRVAPDEPGSEEGWTVVELELLGGVKGASEVLQRMVAQGVVVGRFERVGTSLADLIERVVSRSRGTAEGSHA